MTCLFLHFCAKAVSLICENFLSLMYYNMSAFFCSHSFFIWFPSVFYEILQILPIGWILLLLFYFWCSRLVFKFCTIYYPTFQDGVVNFYFRKIVFPIFLGKSTLPDYNVVNRILIYESGIIYGNVIFTTILSYNCKKFTINININKE